MRKIILMVEDETEILCVTTISDNKTYKRVNATAFDVRNTNKVTMPEYTSFNPDKEGNES